MHMIELRLNRHPAGRYQVVYYTIDKVWPGIGNITYGQCQFLSYHEAAQWAKTEWPKVPLIRN